MSPSLLRCFVVLALTATVAVPARGQSAAPESEEPAVVPVIAWWVPGEERHVEVRKGVREYEADSLKSEQETRILYRLNVLEETETSYLVRWTPVEYEGPEHDFDPVAAGVDEEVYAELEEVGLLVETTELGEFVGIANIEAVQAVMKGVIDVLYDEMILEQPELADNALMRDARDAVVSREYLEQKAYEEILYYYSLHGYEYPIGEAWEYSDLIPNLLGGPPLLARGHAEIVEFDEADGFFVLENVLETDEHEMRQMLEDLIARAGPDAAVDLSGMEMRMVERNRVTTDFFSGWVHLIDRTRDTVAMDYRRHEYTIIRLVEL